MKGTKGFAEDVLIKEVTKDEVKLIVIASRSETDWELSVQNEHGISSNWLECFASAQHAIDAGLQAIEEGIEPFIDTDGFEYLFD